MMHNNKAPVRHPRNVERRLRRKRALRITLLVVLSVVIIVASLLAMFWIFYRPQKGNTTRIDGGGVSRVTDEGGNMIETTSPEREIGRKENFYNFLVLGRDNVGLNTDVFMLVSFDIDGKAISICQIPRDTYVEIDGRAYKINAAYGHMHSVAYSNGEKDTEDAGMRGLMQLLERDMGVVIDDYALVNIAGFRNIIDLIGGVEINVPCDMDYDDPDQDLYIHLKKGYQTLDGDKAEQFVRFRADYAEADLGRQDAQKLFISAVIRKLKNSISVSTITGMLGEISKNVKTSVTALDLAYYVKEFYLIDNAAITFLDFPGAALRDNVTYGAWYYVMNRPAIYQMVNRYFNVWDEDIPEESFYPDRAFVKENKSHFLEVYDAPAMAEETHNAQDLIESGISIPLNP